MGMCYIVSLELVMEVLDDPPNMDDKRNRAMKKTTNLTGLRMLDLVSDAVKYACYSLRLNHKRWNKMWDRSGRTKVTAGANSLEHYE